MKANKQVSTRKSKGAKAPKTYETTKSAPLAISNKVVSKRPVMNSNGNGTVVSHREILAGSVTNAPTFSVSSVIAVQPAISTYSHGSPLGTWVPGIAKQYDNYEFLKLKVMFFTSAASTTSGTVVMSYDPNPDGQVPDSFSGMLNSAKAVSGAVRENLTLDLTDRVRGRKLLTRDGSVGSYPLYDAGRVFIATLNSQGGDDSAIGYIEVEYTLRFTNPQVAPRTTSQILYVPNTPKMFYKASNSATYSYNCATECCAGIGDLFSTVLAVANTGYITASTFAVPVFTATADNGCVFTSSAPSSRSLYRVDTGGRYRVRVQINGDFEDLKMFALGLLNWSSGGSPVLARTYLPITGDHFATVPVTHRGFTGTAIGDPNPGTDLGIQADWECNLATGAYVAPALGIRNYNSVSTTTANFTIRPGVGPSYILFEYLGPVE